MPREDEFLDDIETAEAELEAEELAEEEALELEEEVDELEALRAERDDFRDKFMRALADAENSRKRADKQRRDDLQGVIRGERVLAVDDCHGELGKRYGECGKLWRARETELEASFQIFCRSG